MTTTSVDVCNAIAKVVGGLWPDRMIYRDFCPVDHQRPSSFLYLVKSSFEPANVSLVEWSMEAELELFCASDEYDLSSTEALRQDQEDVLLAFGQPSLPVGDRYVTIQAMGDGADQGSAFVKFTATWFDQRPGYHDPEDMTDPVSAGVPKMEEIENNSSFSAQPLDGRTNLCKR